MAESLHSPLWYRVASLRPQLCSHVRIHRHHYRGQRWYILQDRASGAAHRFSPAAHHLIGLMDGKRSVNELWETGTGALGDDALTQQQVIKLLGQLHAADALQCDVPPDSAEVFQRHQQHTRQQWRQRLLTPLAVRVPLLDPERFLTRWLPLVRPLFSKTGFALWLAIVLTALSLTGLHWPAITDNLVDRVLTPQNLFLLWLTFPLVKALHELGHAFATRVWGGEVHEMGIMFLALVPIPYVDASSATCFVDKHRRMLVGAAGMVVELLLAAVALFIWLSVEPGIVSAVAYNVMLIGSVSTLFFNGNPLLRFDGYYILADAIEIPNLAGRANRYLGYLVQRYLFGTDNALSPVTARGETGWFVCYGITSFIYRIFILCVILFHVASKYFVVGIVLALWAAATQIILPLLRSIASLFGNPGLRRQRLRAASITGLTGLLLAWVLFFMPAPSWTRSEGVVWLPEQARIRAGTDCFITRILVESGTRVAQGDAVMQCADPLLAARQRILDARLRELNSQYAAERQDDYVKAEGIREEIKTTQAEIVLVREQIDALTLHSSGEGQLVIPHADDLVGTYIHQGDVVAYILGGTTTGARVVITQDRISLVRQHTRNVQVRLAGYPGRAMSASIKREVPAATTQLPSRALGTQGGGRIAVEPDDETGTASLEHVFQLELALNESAPADYFGQRVYVRFDHGSEPLARQWQRSLRQLFMRQFGA